MKELHPGFILPSAAYTASRKQLRYFASLDRLPRVGDVIYGVVTRIGQHGTLENKNGRIHLVQDGSRAVFVFGNRYAPDYYEAVVPTEPVREVDLVARSGVVGSVRVKNSAVKDPTRVRVLGYVHDGAGNLVNTTEHRLIASSPAPSRSGRRARLILVVGTAMNAGKSTAATACCWALSSMGHTVRASKVTGTASLKDILHMNDAGATTFNDFTHLGYPSTYLLDEEQVTDIFDSMDARYANNPRNYWVVEIADGILQRETAMLLRNERVQSRIHRLIFCAGDALGALAGVQVLKREYGLEPDAISGLVSSSPLGVAELRSQLGNIPVFNSLNRNLQELTGILI